MKKVFIPIACLFFLLISCTNQPSEKASIDATNSKWWKEAVVYQIYPRSFKDSDGDGVGDLKGIISKLDYIKSLGVDVIWLNPIFSSPNADNGYDISDYKGIMKEFGTMEDFDAMLKAMHERGLKLVLDLVPNHSSDQHEWFKQSRSSRTNPYRNYYHWWPAEKGKPAKRFSFFDDDAWKYDTTTNAYYLHYFSYKQPDLNWENPTVRNEMYNIMRFWFDKGVDGFRMDVLPFISKDTSFPQITEKFNNDFGKFYYNNGTHLHDYLQEMNKKVLSKYDIMTVAEGAGVHTDNALDLVDEDRHELNMLYQFEGTDFGYVPGKFKVSDPNGYSLIEFKKIYTKWDSVFAEKGWGTIYLGNHDQPRMVTRWGNDDPAYREASSKMLTTFLMTMRATPYYYFGDELGMNNIKFDKIEDYNDIETINHYQAAKKNGEDVKAFIEAQKISARDNGRTPFQWDATANAGFTTGNPWLKVNPNYKNINFGAEVGDMNSCLSYFKKIVKLRKSNKILVYGKYQLLDKDNPKVYAYIRTSSTEKWLVLLNFSKDVLLLEPKKYGAENRTKIISNYATEMMDDGNIPLQPYEAKIYKLN